MPRDYRDIDTLIEDIEWLGSFHPSRDLLLSRLGILDEALHRRLSRAGRLDIWDRYFLITDERDPP